MSVGIYCHVLKQTIWLQLRRRFSRDLETARFEPGSAGWESAALPQSYRASVMLQTFYLLYFKNLKIIVVQKTILKLFFLKLLSNLDFWLLFKNLPLAAIFYNDKILHKIDPKAGQKVAELRP